MLIEWMDEREQAQNLDANAQPDEETRITQELIRRVMEQVLADEGVQMETVVGVTLVDPDRIREINNAFRQVDSQVKKDEGDVAARVASFCSDSLSFFVSI